MLFNKRINTRPGTEPSLARTITEHKHPGFGAARGARAKCRCALALRCHELYVSPTRGLIRLENSLFCWLIFPDLSPPALLRCLVCIRRIPSPPCPARLFFSGFAPLTTTGNENFFFFWLLSLFQHVSLLCKYRLKCSRVWDARGSTQGSRIAGDIQMAQAAWHEYPPVLGSGWGWDR